MPVNRWGRAQLTGKRVSWLFDLTYAGRVIRLSTEPLNVSSTKLGDLQYAGVLDTFNVPLSLDLFTNAASLLSVKIAGVLPINVPKLVAEGHDLGAATGVLSQWIEGTTYESRRIVLRGKVRDPIYGAEDEPTKFALEDNMYEDRGLIPDVSAAVTLDTWGEADPNTGDPLYLSLATGEKELAYPFVFGNPGKVSAAVRAEGWITGSQAVWFWHDLFPDGSDYEGLGLVIAGHRVTAQFVYLNTAAYTDGERFLVKHRADGLGRIVAYVDYRVTDPPSPNSYSSTDAVGTYYGLGDAALDPSFQPDRGEQSDVYVGWYDPINEDGGGMVGADGLTVRGAGDVLAEVLALSSLPIDRARVAALAPTLNRFKIDGVVEAGVKPWEWIAANLLPILPISVLKGPDGVYFVGWRYDATAADAVGHIDAGTDPGIEVSPEIRYDNSKVLNSFSLKYALSIRTGNYQATAVLDETNSYHCGISQRRYAEVDPDGFERAAVYSEALESTVIYDDDTAAAVLGWRALAFSLARREVTLLVPEASWAYLERGNVVLLTVPWLYFARVVCLVADIESGDDGLIGLRLLLIEDPPRESRVTE